MSAFQTIDTHHLRFHKAKLLGQRAIDISHGAPIYVAIDATEVDALIIARKEWDQGVLPLQSNPVDILAVYRASSAKKES
jgi:DNA-directed RNA polymerase subunit K